MISIVIPAYNEQDVIVDTIEKARLSVSTTDLAPAEIIVVDDGSSDETAARAAKTGVKVIRHAHNVGYGRSLKDGITAAQHDTIVIIDADGTYPINRIPDLVREYQKGFDMVIGARQGRHLDSSSRKRWLRRALKWMVEFTTGRKIADINSGMRVFSRKESMKFFPNLSNAFSFTTSITLAYMMTVKFVTFVPIDYYKRSGESKVHLFRDILRTMQYITEAILYYNPLKLFIVFAGFIIVLGVLSLLLAWMAASAMLESFGFSLFWLALLVFALGLVSIQLKQILHARTE